MRDGHIVPSRGAHPLKRIPTQAGPAPGIQKQGDRSLRELTGTIEVDQNTSTLIQIFFINYILF